MRFLMIAQPRTGTTLFRSLVNKHPAVYLYGELFFPGFFVGGWYSHLLSRLNDDKTKLLPTQWASEVLPFLELTAARKRSVKRLAVGVDMKIPQTQLIPNLHRRLKTAELGILHMRRRNTLAAIVSHETMTARVKRGAAVHGKTTTQNDPIQFDIERLRLRIAAYEMQDSFIKLTYRDRPYIEIFYEDFTTTEGWKQTCPRLGNFFATDFNVEYAPVLKKQNSNYLPDLIQNAAEVRAAFPNFFDAEA